MKKQSFTAFDAADYLVTEADVAAYLEAANEDGDPQVLVSAMGDVIRARNVSKVARDAGLTREGLYKAFSGQGNPTFATVVKVAKALKLDVGFRARKSARASPGPSRSPKSSAKARGRTSRASQRGAKP